MNFYVIARKDTRTVVEHGVADIPTGVGINPEKSASQEWFEAKAVANALTADEVSYASFGDSEIQAHNDGHGYVLEWSESEISGIVFDLLDDLNWIECVIAEGAEFPLGTTINVTVNSLLPDKSGVDTSDNSKVKVSMNTPDGNMPGTVQLASGTATFQYTPKAGFYTIPTGTPDNYRLTEVKRLECQIPFSV